MFRFAEAQPNPEEPYDVIISNVDILHVKNGDIESDRNVYIKDRRIQKIGPGGSVAAGDAAKVVDGTGKYLIPGLWDMHMHALNRTNMIEMNGREYNSLLSLFLANGVTGIRDMWGRLDIAEETKKSIRSGEMAGPVRIYAAGAIVNGPTPYPQDYTVATPETAVNIVDSLHQAGSDFIKVYFNLDKETYYAIARRTRELNMPFAGHTPFYLTVAECSDAGQRSIEHMTGILKATSAREDSLNSLFVQYLESMDIERMGSIGEIALKTQDQQAMDRLFQKLKQNNTWQVPTLVSLRGKAYLTEFQKQGDERTRYFTPTDRWLGPGPFGYPLSEAQRKAGQAGYEREKELVGLMAEAGVPLLAGSDFGTPWVFPGFSIHDELELFVEAGLTPLQSLQTATLNPAKFFERTEELGAIEETYLADLLLLDANPLENISNTKKIHAVIADGRLYSREDLDQFLSDTAEKVKLETSDKD